MAIPEVPVLSVRNNGGTVVRLGFAPVPGATSYKVYRALTPNATTLLATVDASPTYDTTAVVGTIYYYRLKSSNADGDSAYSNEGMVLAAAEPSPLTPTAALRIVRTF